MARTIIIGGGVVGATAAYYLSRQGHQVTLFDEGKGQATSASAGIICPWFSLRRNKPWYYLVSNGAEFYRKLVVDLQEDGFDTHHIFKEIGTVFIRRNQKRVDQDLQMAQDKMTESPSIKVVKALTPEEISQYAPFIESDFPGFYVKGGARVDGQWLIQALHQAVKDSGGRIISEKAHLGQDAKGELCVKSANHKMTADHYLLAVGPHLPQLLKPLHYEVDIHPQKGQLYTVSLPETINDKTWPVIMPFGVGDIIPMNNGTVTIGATHEDDGGFDLSVDWGALSALKEEAITWMPSLKDFPVKTTRVGTRAHTSDYSVLVGEVPGMDNVTAISGLGSSGLTSGPFLGFQYAQKILTGQWDINPEHYLIENYIQSTK